MNIYTTKSKGTITAVLFGLAILLLGGLILTQEKKADIPNGFLRNYSLLTFAPRAIVKNKEIKDLAGSSKSRLYFSTTTPGKIIVMDHKLRFIRTILINLDTGLLLQMNKYHFTKIDSPFVYLFAYNIPAIIKYSMHSKSHETVHLSIGGFSTAAVLSETGLALRKLDTTLKDQLFVNVNLITRTETREKDISEIYHDGGLITDGILHSDRLHNQFVFLNYYRNKFIVMDTNLTLRHNYHTIDTFAHFRVRSGKNFAGNTAFTIDGSNKIINPLSCVDNGILYVNSTLRADNDNKSFSRKKAVIDMYKIKTGEYLGSFAIPLVKGSKMKRFSVLNATVIVIDVDSIKSFRIHHGQTVALSYIPTDYQSSHRL